MSHGRSKFASPQCARGAPPIDWRRILLLAACLFAGSVGGLEAFWRGQGFRPSVTDSKDLWYFWRQQVYRPDGKVVVLLGSSRINADISLETMRRCLPGFRVVQLGVSGAFSPIGLLEDLRDDKKFNGLIVCELDAPLLDRRLWHGRDEYRYYRPSSHPAHFDALARAWLSASLIGGQSDFTLKGIAFRAFGLQAQPKHGRLSKTFDRQSLWRFSEATEALSQSETAEYARRYAMHHFLRWEELSTDAADVETMVRSLQSRGGDVVFLRAPSTGARWQLEEQYHPRAENWNRFAASTSAITIHFADCPLMRSFSCPDESHLDYRDSAAFTRALVRQIDLSRIQRLHRAPATTCTVLSDL